MDRYLPFDVYNWAAKYICSNKYYLPFKTIHKVIYKDNKQTCEIPKNQIKFNHYNLDKPLIHLATQRYKK